MIWHVSRRNSTRCNRCTTQTKSCAKQRRISPEWSSDTAGDDGGVRIVPSRHVQYRALPPRESDGAVDVLWQQPSAGAPLHGRRTFKCPKLPQQLDGC